MYICGWIDEVLIGKVAITILVKRSTWLGIGKETFDLGRVMVRDELVVIVL